MPGVTQIESPLLYPAYKPLLPRRRRGLGAGPVPGAARRSERLMRGALAPATASEIGKAGDAETQREIADRVLAEHLSHSETIEAVRVAAKRTLAKPGKGRGVRRTRKVPTSRTLKAAG